MAVYFPESIENQDIYGTFAEPSTPDSEYNALKVTQYPTKILPVIMPQVPTANDTIGHSINTKTNKILGSYSFGKVGSLQIGSYESGTSGDIRITPNGITARNSSGTNTFAIDGTTGNASFFGTIQAGSVVVGYVASTGGNYTTTAATAAKVMLLPDANTGIIAYASDGTSVVFRVLVGGSNVGDVQIGNYSNNNGVLWDDSQGKFLIRGDISASTISTGTTGNRVQMETAQDQIKWYDSTNDVGLQIGLTSSTYADIVSFDNRALRLTSDTGTVQFNNNNLGGLGNITTSGTITGGTISGSHTGTGSFSSISMSGGLNMGGNSITSVNQLTTSGTIRGGSQFSCNSRSAVDKSSGAGGTYSLEVSNNNGNGRGLADQWDTYSEYTEIEIIAPQYRLSEEESAIKAKEQILKRVEYKTIAAFNNPFLEMTQEELDAELIRVLTQKDWSKEIEGEVKGERVSSLEWGTLLAFSEQGAVPTNTAGQTNVMGVVSSYPSIVAHQQEKGIPVCKKGKTYMKVIGTCQVGDLLQASNTEGCAEKAPANVNFASFVGRARVNKTSTDVEIIEVDID